MDKRWMAILLPAVIIVWFGPWFKVLPWNLHHHHATGINPLIYYRKNAINTIQGATRTEVFRLKEGPVTGELPLLNERYTVIYKGQTQGQKFTSRLSKVLLSPETYGGMPLACFSPGVAFRLWHENKSVTAYICFHCNNMRLVEDTGSQPREEVPIYEGRDVLLELSKESLPNDSTIQSLK